MRIIPIGGAAGLRASACGEDSGEVPKLGLPLARREFLEGSGVLMGTLTVGSVLALLAPSPVWAVELKTLTQSDGETLMATRGFQHLIHWRQDMPKIEFNDDWKSFSQLAWLDPHTTSGTWRVANDFSGLPAWICKTVGGTKGAKRSTLYRDARTCVPPRAARVRGGGCDQELLHTALPCPSTHKLGTFRMDASAKDSVCNADGQTHDVSNLFISDGSQSTAGGAENPTLTIVTLATRPAEYIAKQMSARAI